jgi:hypothetical protein
MCVQCKAMIDPVVLGDVRGSNVVTPPVPDRKVVRCDKCGADFYVVVEDED